MIKADIEKIYKKSEDMETGVEYRLPGKSNRLVKGGIKAAIFDYDGTIVDSMPMWLQASSNYVRSLGKVPAQDLDNRIKNLGLEEGAAVFRDEYGAVGTTEEIVEAVLDMVRDNYRYRIKPKAGVLEVLEDLKAAGVKMVVATASARDMIEICNEVNGLEEYFEAVFTCVEVGANKRKPDIYLEAAKFLGVKPEEALVFEDVHHAAKTACEAGFPVVGIYDDASFLEKDDIYAVSSLYIEDYSQWPGIAEINAGKWATYCADDLCEGIGQGRDK